MHTITKKTELRIGIVDFWKMTVQEKQRFLSIFQHAYTVIEDSKTPDLLFYSCFGDKHLEYNHCKKLFYSGENVVPDFNTCDYAISTVKIDYAGRNLWIPQSHWDSDMCNESNLAITKGLTGRKFCSFIYSQDTPKKGSKLRKLLCKQLMKYKNVDCPGKVMHNMDSPILSARNDVNNWRQSKLEFLRGYKFNIAFENSEAPGYITEKLVDCYMANTVPIYWGSSGDVYPYPKESMICANDYDSVDDLVIRIIEIDNNDEEYLSILQANPFRAENKHQLPDFQSQIHVFLNKVITSEIEEDREPMPITDAQRCYKYQQIVNTPHVKATLKIEHFLKYLRLLPKKLLTKFFGR